MWRQIASYRNTLHCLDSHSLFFPMLISSMRYSPAAGTLKVRSGNDGWAVVMLFFFWFLSECSTSFTCRWWWWWDANEWTNEEENPKEEKQQHQQFSGFEWAEWMECLIVIFPGPWNQSRDISLPYSILLLFRIVVFSLFLSRFCFICILPDSFSSLVLSLSLMCLNRRSVYN